ncbi:MAG TPA: histidine phosphatase family protein [Bryobacteraceae bacterium]|nr:histidine phosphatase family protein [Bryobacteraceae bacterium]
MGRILLVRHADHPLAAKTLVGRDNNTVRLSEFGRRQAAQLAEVLADEAIDCLQSSPRLRCIETAEALATEFDLPVVIEGALDEIDFGAWTGVEFAQLHDDPKWYAWNVRRTRTRPPGGETIAEARTRLLQHIDAMSHRYPTRTIAMVTHAEMIRAVRLHRAGLSADAWKSIDVPLASITELAPVRFPESTLEAAAS